jgi:hypothetical protein
MTTRSKGPGAGFGWLKNGFSVGFRHPKPLLGGAAFLVIACLLPALITLPMQIHVATAGTPPNPTTYLGIMAISMLISLLLVPLQAGYLQLVDAAERGLPARALDIFNPYRRGEALRLIGYGLAVIVVYVAIIGLIFVVTTGGGTADWYIQALAAQANHQPSPTLPNGFGIAIALFLVLWLLIMGFLAISLGQVALGHRNVFGAISDGLTGAVKNVLPLLVFGVSALLTAIGLVIAFAIVDVLVVLLGKLVGAWLVLVLLTPVYITLLMGMFIVMFGTIYHLWRDVCGSDIVPDMAEAIAA